MLRVLSCWFIVASALVVGSTASAQKCTSPDFKVELIYRAPEIEHPSVVTCDDEGNLYVGEDPMDMRGPTTKHFDRIILIRWDKTTGQPIRTVFAENLAAVFGLIWRDGALYVMHAPLYSVLRDTNGDGVADERKELASGFGPDAGIYGFNDHIVTGTRLGMDGKVYVSVGDKGVPKATGGDGSTISLEGGGVVRMNLDGTQLEVVTSGTRNHLDVAMDSLDNIFTYDNTDDGLGWWTRFTHHVPTGYYGYPYDYHPHPERHLPRMSEHGGGSPVGAACYREAAWPEKYRDAAFMCDWGKGKIQVFYLKKNGATFENTMEDFLIKDGNEEFRPQDVCFSPDGKTMYVADWNFGGWVNPKVCGRLFKVTYVGPKVAEEPARAPENATVDQLIASLGHPAHSERMRAQHLLAQLGAPAMEATAKVLTSDANPSAKIHAIWTQNELIDRQAGYDPSSQWSKTLASDENADVRGQAARALGERRFKSGVEALVKAMSDEDAGVCMRAAIALGRIGDARATESLFTALSGKDEFVRHTAIQALRAIGDWKLASDYLGSDQEIQRNATLVALTTQYNFYAVSALAKYAENGPDVALRAKAIESLAEVHRIADPYTKGWWGTQPARGKPSRAKTHDWSGTSLVLSTVRDAAVNGDPASRAAAVKALRDIGDAESLPLLVKLTLDNATPIEVRRDALDALVVAKKDEAAKIVSSLVSDDKTPREMIVKSLEVAVSLKSPTTAAAIASRLKSDDAGLRAKAIEAYAKAAPKEAGPAIIAALKDAAPEVRTVAVRTAGESEVREAIPALIAMADNAADFQAVAAALAAMPDKRAVSVYLQGLADKNNTVRDACRNACSALKAVIGEEIIARHQGGELLPETRRELQKVFAGATPISNWWIVGAWSQDVGEPKFDFAKAPDLTAEVQVGDRKVKWKEINSKDAQGKVSPGDHVSPTSQVWSVAYTAVKSDTAQEIPYALGSDDKGVLIVNGKELFRYVGDRGWNPASDQGTLHLNPGVNHIYFLCGNNGGPWDFSLALRMKNEKFAFLYDNLPPQLDIAAFRAHATKNRGDELRGMALFNDLKGVACVKCHAIAGKGGKIGPDLLGIGAKYPREELIRSILEPSVRVAESFQVTKVITDDGKVTSGIIKSENEKEIELLDAEGKSRIFPRDTVEEVVKSTVSLMPNGLKDGMSLQDFADVVAYLESLKQIEVKK